MCAFVNRASPIEVIDGDIILYMGWEITQKSPGKWEAVSPFYICNCEPGSKALCGAEHCFGQSDDAVMDEIEKYERDRVDPA